MVTPRYRRYALSVLLLVNLLNYVDRQVLYAVFPLVKSDLHLSDAALGLLGSGFMFSYICSAPLFGWIGDRWNRIRLAAGGLGLWSVATAAAGFVGSYGSLMAARGAVGIGEASFGTVSPGLVADYFPAERRGRVMSLFYLAIPVGSALGYLLGGMLGQRFGWQSCFLFVGLPGLLLALPLWLLREPRKQAVGLTGSAIPREASVGSLFRNRPFLLNTLGMAAMTFALGGLAQWIPSFLQRAHGLGLEKANLLFGAITVVAGIGGTLTGGFLGDYFQKRSGRGYLLVSGWGFLAGAPIAAWALVAADAGSCLTAVFLAEFFLFLNTGPLNTVIINVTGRSVRARAFAVNIFVIHALGDAVSPSIIGFLSDRFGLRHALLVAPAAISIAALFCFICAGSMPRRDEGPVEAHSAGDLP